MDLSSISIINIYIERERDIVLSLSGDLYSMAKHGKHVYKESNNFTKQIYR